MNRIDWQAKTRHRRRLRREPRRAPGSPPRRCWCSPSVAFVVRVASRWFLFNAGRDAEYELRFELLRKLHQLGAGLLPQDARRRDHEPLDERPAAGAPALGFGVLNVVNVVLRVRERPAGHARGQRQARRSRACSTCRSSRSSRAASRAASSRACATNQAALGQHERRAAGEPRRRARRAELRARGARARRASRRPTATTSRRASRSRGCAASFAPTIGAVAAIGILVFFWYGSSLLLRGPESTAGSRRAPSSRSGAPSRA